MKNILETLMSLPAEPEPTADIQAWWRHHRTLAATFPRPVDQALAGGFAADRPGYAFASGYHAAGRALVPQLGDGLGALCATEAGGVHPGVIETRLEDVGPNTFRVTGEKTIVTLGTEADVLLVVASQGRDEAGRNRLRLVLIDREGEGVTVSPLDPLPFVPEIPHAAIRFEKVCVTPEQVLPGDGYLKYLKPFRTIEDIHVHAGVMGWVLQVARRCPWPEPTQEEILDRIVAIRALSEMDPTRPTTHLALAGALRLTRRLLDETATPWDRVDERTRTFLERDRPLLEVAGRARDQRRLTAWRKVQQTPAR